jgi:TonB family protein
MQSCQVCLDNAAANAPMLTPRAPTTERELAREPEISREPELSRLIAVDPKYPSSAASSGTEGFVEISFTVTPLGRVENAIVTAAEPPGVFEQAALAAISRWRYSAEEGRAAATLTHRFDFQAKDAAVAPAAPIRATVETAIDSLIAHSSAYDEDADTEPAAGEPPSVVRNQCIREQVSYDFGEMVEVNLMNTCGEPVMVSAAPKVRGAISGAGCQSSENSQICSCGQRSARNVTMIGFPKVSEPSGTSRICSWPALATRSTGGSRATSTTPSAAAAAGSGRGPWMERRRA